MAFTSFRFIVFLVLAAAAYFLTPKRCRWVTLFVANYVFYFISGGKIFIYLLATTITTYLAAVKIGDMAAKNKIAFNEAKANLDKEGKKAVEIGRTDTHFFADIKNESGTYTYIVTPIDTAGNFGKPKRITLTVAQPPDYIMYVAKFSLFNG